MCEPARLIVTSSASSPLMRSASSTAFLIASTAASGLTITPLRRPRASASPMPTTSSNPPSPGSPAIHVTLLVPMSRPMVCCVRLAMSGICVLLVLTFSYRVITGNQSNYRAFTLREIDVADQWSACGLTLRVEYTERFAKTCTLILRAESNFDLRIIISELHPHVMQIEQVHFAHTLCNSLRAPIALQFEKLAYAIAILRRGGVRVVFVPTAEEEGRHLIGRRHLTEKHRIVIDPHEASGSRAHHRFRFALSDSHANAIRKNTRDNCGAHPRQMLKVTTKLLQVSAPHASLTHIVAHEILDVVN